MRPIKKGSTDQSIIIRIVDSTAGTPEEAVEHDTSGIALWYRREGATKTAITPAALAALDTAHSDGGIEHIDDGYYRLDLPDAAVASGADGVMVGGTVTGMIIVGCYVPLVSYDPQDSVRMGMIALPAAAADGAGGLPISDDGGLDLDNIIELLAHADYGLAKLVRSTTPANTLSVDANHLVAVPDTQKVDLETIKTKAITCGAAVTVRADVGHAGIPGAENGAPYVAAGGAKLAQTVDLTAGQSIACSDKTGFALSSTGADLILKSSTFIQAIVAAINELATYGLTALNTLLVTTGIKTATTAAPADMALDSTVAKEATLGTIAGYIDTEIAAIKAKTDNLPASPAAVGSAMTLADDAITAAKFDETTAFPLAASDAGATAVARTGADGDTLETLSDQIDDVPTVAEFEARSTADPATATNQATIAGYIDTDVAAIKAKTDRLTFTSGDNLDVNIQGINDETLIGDGSTGNPWRRTT